MTRRGHRLAILLLLLPAAGFVTLFLAAVAAMTVLQSVGFFSFGTSTQIGLDSWVAVLNQQTLDSLVYSTRIALVSSLGGLVFAYPLSLVLRRAFAGRDLFNALLRIPLFIPALVAAFLVMNVLSFHGVLNTFLVMLGIIDQPLRLSHDGWGLGVVAIQVWKNVPFQALILSAALANIPSDLESAARNLGAGRLAVFRHVLFPLSMPGLLTGVVLVFIGVFGDYAINSIAGPLYPPSLSIRMYLLAHNFGEWGQAAAIALIIITGSALFAVLASAAARLGMRPS